MPRSIVLKRWHVLPPLLAMLVYYYRSGATAPPSAPTPVHSDGRAAAAEAASRAAAATAAVDDGSALEARFAAEAAGIDGQPADSAAESAADAAAAERNADWCVDRAATYDCQTWAAQGECDKNPPYMLAECAKACGCRAVAAADASEPACVDRDKSGACAQWSAAGECEKNPAFMKLKCAASCGTCDWLDYKKRCPMPADRVPAVAAHAMSASFERALSDFPELEPLAISREPWVMSFERFLSDEEVEALLAHAEGRYERSTASGGRKDDEFIPLQSDIRTSWTTWCDTPTCLADPIIQRIYNKVANVTRVPPENFEYLQLLRYKSCEHARAADCQFYRRHHDTIPELTAMQPGPRVYTFFLYLSDVEEGGGTRFDGEIGTVYPAKGKALWWPATKEAEPFVSDDRTHHEALPVTKGVKYSANFWLHQYDYVGPHNSGCTT